MPVGKPSSTVRVVMAKAVAHRWLAAATHSEYRFSIFGFDGQAKSKRFASTLRSLRDRRRKESPEQSVLSIPAISDLGVRERGDMVEVWSSDVEGLRKLAQWAETMGLNTDFIW